MAKYLLIEEQGEEGCDYSIGCGMRYEFVEFDGDIDAASIHFANYVAGEDEDGCSDDRIESALLVGLGKDGQFSVVQLDLERVRREALEQAVAYAMEQKEAEERATLERLKKKFEGKK